MRQLLGLVAFRRLWAATSVSSFGDWLGLLAMTTLAQQLTEGKSAAVQGVAISGVILTRLLPDLLFGALAGAIADRLDRRMTVIIGEVAAAALYISIIAVYDLKFLYIAQFIIESIGLFTVASKQALWIGSVPKKHLPVANQVALFSVYGAVPIAALVFALLSTLSRLFLHPTAVSAGTDAKFPIIAATLLDAGSYLFSASTIWVSRKHIAAHAADRPEEHLSIWALIREGVHFVAGHPVIRSLYIGILGAFAAGGLIVGVAQLYVKALNAGAAGYATLLGTVFTGLAIGMLIGPKILPALSRRRIFGTAIACAGASLIGMALVRNLVLSVATAAAVGLFGGIAWIIGYTLIGQEVEDRLRGRTYAFVASSARIMLFVTVGLGPSLAGVMGKHDFQVGDVEFVFEGPSLTLMIGGILAMLVGAYAGRTIPEGGLHFRDVFAKAVERGDQLIARRGAGSGLFVVLEGADVDLVARQAVLLADVLREEGQPVLVTREPTESEAGRRTRAAWAAVTADSHALEPETQVLLSTADTSEHVAKVIRPALEAGQIVICDEYVDSTFAYFGGEGGADPDWIMRVCGWGSGGLVPDLTVVIDSKVDDRLEGIRKAFVARAAAASDGYAVVTMAAGETDELVPEILRHTKLALTLHHAQIGATAPEPEPSPDALPEPLVGPLPEPSSEPEPLAAAPEPSGD